MIAAFSQSELGLRSGAKAQGTKGLTFCLEVKLVKDQDGARTEQQSDPRTRGIRRSSRYSVQDKDKTQWKNNNNKRGWEDWPGRQYRGIQSRMRESILKPIERKKPSK